MGDGVHFGGYAVALTAFFNDVDNPHRIGKRAKAEAKIKIPYRQAISLRLFLLTISPFFADQIFLVKPRLDAGI